MLPGNNFRLIVPYICLLSISCLMCVSKGVPDLSIGLIVDKESKHILETFRTAIKWSNYRYGNDKHYPFRLLPRTDVLDVTDSFAISNAICDHLDNNVFGIIGYSNTPALSTIQSYTNTFRVPFVKLSMAPNSSITEGFQIFMRPINTDAMVDLMFEYSWNHIVYIYNSDEGLIRLQELFQSINNREYALEIDVKRVENVKSCLSSLREMYVRSRGNSINVLFDLPYQEVLTVLSQVKKEEIFDHTRFNILLSDLTLSEQDFDSILHYGFNITGFQLVQHNAELLAEIFSERRVDNSSVKMKEQTVPCEEALLLDAVEVLTQALHQLFKNRPSIYKAILTGYVQPEEQISLKCADKIITHSNYGKDIIQQMKLMKMKGFTGFISFDNPGHRRHFTLDVIQTINTQGTKKIGYWSHDSGLHLYMTSGVYFGSYYHVTNRTKVVTLVSSPI